MGEISRVASNRSGVEVGRLMGRREAFAAVSGRCSAAEAESLRRLRDEKAYREFGLTWEEFCEKRLGARLGIATSSASSAKAAALQP